MWTYTSVSDTRGTCVLNRFRKYGFPLSNKEDMSKTEFDTDVIPNENSREYLPPYLRDEKPKNFYFFDDVLSTDEESDDISLFTHSNNEEESNNNDGCTILDKPTV